MTGFCAPNIIDPFTRSDLAVVRAGRFGYAKLRHYHTRDHVAQLRAVGVNGFLAMFPDLHPGDDLDEHVDKCWETILATYPLCNIWQTANEPNDPKEWRGQPWIYQSHMRYVMERVQAKAKEARIQIYYVLPPLAYTPEQFGEELQEWKDAFVYKDRPPGVESLVDMHDYAGANCYWEYPKFMLDGAYGMAWQDVAAWSGLPPIILEYGYSGHHTLKEPDPVKAHAIMRAQYPVYVATAKKRGAVAEFVFHVGGTSHWVRYAIPDSVARSMSPTPTVPS